MIAFNCYASGSSGNVYTISDGCTLLMLECGLPWKKIRQLLNFQTSNVQGICVSHSHLDHSKGISEAARTGVDVYASRATLDALKLSGHRYVEIYDRGSFKIGTWEILPFSVDHDCDGSLGFLMTNKIEERFLFLTDSASCPVTLPPLTVIAAEANFISEILINNVMEGHLPAVVGNRIRNSHLSLETLIGMLKGMDLSRCRQIFLLHMSDGNSDESRMIREVQAATGIPTRAC